MGHGGYHFAVFEGDRADRLNLQGYKRAGLLLEKIAGRLEQAPVHRGRPCNGTVSAQGFAKLLLAVEGGVASANRIAEDNFTLPEAPDQHRQRCQVGVADLRGLLHVDINQVGLGVVLVVELAVGVVGIEKNVPGDVALIFIPALDAFDIPDSAQGIGKALPARAVLLRALVPEQKLLLLVRDGQQRCQLIDQAADSVHLDRQMHVRPEGGLIDQVMLAVDPGHCGVGHHAPGQRPGKRLGVRRTGQDHLCSDLPAGCDQKRQVGVNVEVGIQLA